MAFLSTYFYHPCIINEDKIHHLKKTSPQAHTPTQDPALYFRLKLPSASPCKKAHFRPIMVIPMEILKRKIQNISV